MPKTCFAPTGPHGAEWTDKNQPSPPPKKKKPQKKQEDELLGNGHVISLERGRCMGCAYDRILLLWKPKVGVFSRCARVNRVTCRLDIEPRNQHKLKLLNVGRY